MYGDELVEVKGVKLQGVQIVCFGEIQNNTMLLRFVKSNVLVHNQSRTIAKQITTHVQKKK